MLKWMRGKRFDLRTTVVVIVIALIAWAFVIYMRVQTFVPEEFTEEQAPPQPRLP